MSWHRFPVMCCDNNAKRNSMKYSTYPCIGSSTQKSKCVLKETKPLCNRCGEFMVLEALDCGQEATTRRLRSCIKCKKDMEIRDCRSAMPACSKPKVCCKENILRNKKINTDCILIQQIPTCKRTQKKKRICFETTELRSPASILSLQNKHCLVNPYIPQHHNRNLCHKYYPYHPRIGLDQINRKAYCRAKIKHDCNKTHRKNMATKTSSILKPICVQTTKSVPCCNKDEDLEPKTTLLVPSQVNNDATCTNARSKVADIYCNEKNDFLYHLDESAPCQRPICYDDLSCKPSPCQRPICNDDLPYNPSPCQRPICNDDLPCGLPRKPSPCQPPIYYDDLQCKPSSCQRPICNDDLPCGLPRKPSPCQPPIYYDDPPCNTSPCQRPICCDDLPRKRDRSPCRPCRPPKKRNKKINTKSFSRCWKMKKLPKIRRCKRKKCRCMPECYVDVNTCDRRGSRLSISNCMGNLRTRSIPCCSSTKKTQILTFHDTCSRDICQDVNVIAKMTCNSDSVEKLGPLQTCTPNRVINCGVTTSDTLLRCDLYKREPPCKKCKARRNRLKCCNCMITCAVAVCCAPCFLVAFSYSLLNKREVVDNTCEMPCKQDRCLSVVQRNCNDKYYCALHMRKKCYKKCKARRNREKCCRCMITCAVAVCCAPCFLVALCYCLLKWICDENNCNGQYYIERFKNCNGNGHSVMNCNKNYECPTLDGETVILNGCEDKCRKVSFGEPCLNNSHLCKRPCINVCDERPIRTLKLPRCCKKTYPNPERNYNLYYAGKRGWVIKPISGGGDNNFQCFSPCSTRFSRPRRCRKKSYCSRPETVILLNPNRSLRNIIKKAKCGCLKVLPCGLANALECATMKAKSRCEEWSLPSCAEPKPRCNCNFCCKCPNSIWCRAFHTSKRIFRDYICLDTDSDVCRNLENSLLRNIRPSLCNSLCDITRSTCRLLRYILVTCCCCPIFFCFYCCYECCNKICCCFF